MNHDLLKFIEGRVKADPVKLRQWSAALRSGDYRQIKSKLRIGEGYCCLGVLCETAGIPAEISADGAYEYGGRAGFPLFTQFQTALGLVTSSLDAEHDWDDNAFQALALANDNGATFLEIADAIDIVAEQQQ